MSVRPPEIGSSGVVFSVVVPTHGRPAALARCLRSLADLDCPRSNYEVIVVDDGRMLSPRQQDDLRSQASDVSISIVSQSRSGPATARNAGARLARGWYLAFTDDDCTPARHWLTRLERHLVAHAGALVGGATKNALPAVPFSTASQLLIDYLYDYYHVEMTGARFFTTNNMAMEAEAFRALGGFDGSFPLAAGEDREFCERWQRSGRPLVYAPDAEVSHAHQLDLPGFLRQHFNYGRGADFLHRSRARAVDQMRRPRLEPLGFYVNLVRYPLGRARLRQAVPLAALMCLSQAAYGFGYVLQRCRHIWAPPPPTRIEPARDVKSDAVSQRGHQE
jgi:GT2 family glycosyltransferase